MSAKFKFSTSSTTVPKQTADGIALKLLQRILKMYSEIVKWDCDGKKNIPWQNMPTARETTVGRCGMNRKQSEWLFFPAVVLKCSIVSQAKLPVAQSKRGLDNDWLSSLRATLLCCGFTAVHLLPISLWSFILCSRESMVEHLDMQYTYVYFLRKRGCYYTYPIYRYPPLTSFSFM